VLAAHPSEAARRDAFWIVGGRLVDWGPLPQDIGELRARTAAALRRGGRAGELGAQVPPDEIDEVRVVATYLASHPDLPQLDLEAPPGAEALERFAGQANGSPTTSASPASPA
jgi:hypothetical protein